jgi:uncharacterized protein YndB with AHSA1/START domain
MEAPDHKPGNPRVLRKEVVIAAPIETVWRAWTTEEGLGVVSSRSRVDLTPGGEYSWFLDLEPDAQGRRGSEGSTVVSVTAPREIVFDWTFPPVTPGLRESGATTRVEVRLESVGSGRVALRLSAYGWEVGEEWDRGYAYFDSAWQAVLERMRTALEAGAAS